MKKMIIMTFFVLGMILGSVAVVQPVSAQGGPCGPAIADGDCIVKSCGDCIYVDCGSEGSYIRYFDAEQ